MSEANGMKSSQRAEEVENKDASSDIMEMRAPYVKPECTLVKEIHSYVRGATGSTFDAGTFRTTT